jgi:hypothetical protein
MFVIQEETQTFWFNQNSFENDSEFFLVGCLLGLAIYNSVILDVRFPLVVYKKLLRSSIILEDIKTIDPVSCCLLVITSSHPSCSSSSSSASYSSCSFPSNSNSNPTSTLGSL